nr:unnamed protein product [Callosobruchus analis]
MASPEEVDSELNKLKKADLIRILKIKKVPDDVILSQKVIEALGLCDTDENLEFFDSFSDARALAADNPTLGMRTMAIKCDLKIAKAQLESSNRLVRELERTIQNQELIINLLKAEKSTNSSIKSAPSRGSWQYGYLHLHLQWRTTYVSNIRRIAEKLVPSRIVQRKI